MAEDVSMGIDAIIHLGQAFRDRSQALAELDATIATRQAELTAIEQRIVAAGAYEQAQGLHIGEQDLRLDQLRTHTTPEERALQLRMSEMRGEYAQFEVALQALKRAHQMSLEEVGAMVRRQLSGDLSPRVDPRAITVAQSAALGHLRDRALTAAQEGAL